MEDQTLNGRRQFLASCVWIAAVLATEALTAAGCGSSSSAGSSTTSGAVKGGNCATNGTKIAVGTTGGHTHSAPTVAASDVTAGTQAQYTLGTTDSHSHTITLTSASFDSLKTNQGVSIQTDADGTGHQHAVIVNCS